MNMYLKLDLFSETLYWLDSTPLIASNLDIFEKLQMLFNKNVSRLTDYFYEIDEIDIFINDNEVVATIDENVHEISDSEISTLTLIEDEIKNAI